MTQTPTTPPPEGTPSPEGTPLEIEPIAVSQGTTIDDFGKAAPGVKLRRTLLILAGILFLGLTALAIVFVIGARKLGQETEGLLGELAEAAQGEDDEPPAIDPAEPMITQTFAPTGKTIPGMVYIDSLPDDAQVWVAGEVLGRTPLVIGRSYEGDFVSVKVQKTGYLPWNGKVQVVKGGLRVDVTLEPRPGPQ